MRKIGLLLMLLLLGISGFSVQAASPDDLTRLADYYPDDTAVFFTVRTDDGYIDSLNDLLQQVQAQFPEVFPPQLSLQMLLDQVAFESVGQDYASATDAWLGERFAIGLSLSVEMLMMPQPPFYMMLETIDRDAATSFLEDAIAFGPYDDVYTRIDGDDYTIFESSENFAPTYAVGDDVLFIATMLDAIPLQGVDNPLSADATFTESLALLPADDYNAAVYLNLAALQEFTNEATAMTAGETLTTPMLERLNTLVGAQIWGFTILGGDTLTIDIAQTIADQALIDELGFEPFTAALDLDFAARVPADAPFVLQTADFGLAGQTGLDAYRNFSDWIEANGGIRALLPLPNDALEPEAEILLDVLELNNLLPFLNISFAGLTGLSLERDILGTLDGDMAMFLRFVPDQEGFFIPVVPDFGMVFQASDADRAQTIVESLIDAAEAYDAGYAVEPYGESGNALVIDLISQALGFPMMQFDILMGADGNLFVTGTRAAAEAALETDGGLASTPAWQNALDVFLPGAQQVLYISTAPLVDLVAVAGPGFVDVETAEQIQQVLGIVESSTLTTATNENSDTIVRMTITLGGAE